MARIPSKTEILDWIAENPGLSAKRDIAKAFGIKGAERIELKRLLKELEAEGTLERRRKTYRDAEKLPPVTILMILAHKQAAELLERSGKQAHGSRHRPEISIKTEPPSFRILNRSPLTPSKGEQEANPRSRSARLRAAVRTDAAPWPLDLEALGVPAVGR